ncbi:DegV family protein [Pseudarthrobacter sp. NamB4]|uniref:DegV family protein n=1 Tax=Pseudarthrobacter sp. NamB4 TaxID=2576837 RepID=UPI0010FF4295|nr:DegV family protein [Pseudarthrobacter sp. NamB4]TLM73509.1 DegV family protein [Pseudarthrobacter sp. NamB4]
MQDANAAAWAWFRARITGLRSAPKSGAAVVRTAVVTDSAAALPREWVAALSGDGVLTVIPMPVMVGEEIYGEGEDDISETIALALASGTPVKTSRPSPGQFEQAYRTARRRGFEAVVSVQISGELSGTADAARLAAARVDIPVEVVDSRTVGMAQGLAVQAGVRAAAGGGGAAAVAAAAASQAARTNVYFYVPSLEQLRRGGRIGAAASLLGTMLSIKPILALDGGRIVPLEKVRSTARAVSRLEEIVAADASARPASAVRLAVHHFGNPEEAAGLAGRLAAALPGCPPAQISSLPAVLAAHAGLGVLAVIVGEEPTGAGSLSAGLST